MKDDVCYITFQHISECNAVVKADDGRFYDACGLHKYMRFCNGNNCIIPGQPITQIFPANTLMMNIHSKRCTLNKKIQRLNIATRVAWLCKVGYEHLSALLSWRKTYRDASTQTEAVKCIETSATSNTPTHTLRRLRKSSVKIPSETSAFVRVGSSMHSDSLHFAAKVS